ncbi:uncharacterized protein BYT42DRAFT_557356 [Radiomyces spectabilis]|uniref:uncharacterized protein n=1 Tax=Radiomyces spectabilis TaxID=64574 RepID=UPI002220ED3F|nr:uncharacterized protein BYT42DRAFT_557356 [Radiomyces spectabilis]KAI8391579.1 hypothetical protein BYT42DRAFT_557356 [Radiomyces spectabilis]
MEFQPLISMNYYPCRFCVSCPGQTFSLLTLHVKGNGIAKVYQTGVLFLDTAAPLFTKAVPHLNKADPLPTKAVPFPTKLFPFSTKLLPFPTKNCYCSLSWCVTDFYPPPNFLRTSFNFRSVMFGFSPTGVPFSISERIVVH